jgi:formylglycine-generating enzyme required for sulfatase activity
MRIKYPFLLLFFIIHLPLLLAQAQEDCDLLNYNRLIREAEEYAYGKNGKAVNYKKAIDKLFSARTCQPARESEVSGKILEVFEKVNGERNRAEAALRQVEKEKAATEEQRKIAQQNFEMAQKATEDAENARDRAENALAELQKSNAEIVKLILKNADQEVLNLNYEAALTIIQSAAMLQAAKEEITKSWLEIAFWHAETGDSLRAATLLDSIADFAGIKISQEKPLRENMKTIDADHFKYLFESKYYPEMVFVEGGTFWMGRDTTIDPGDVGDETLHLQEVSSFWMAKYETTVWQFALFCAATGKDIRDFLATTWTDPGDNPVVNVKWKDAVNYANWVSGQKGYENAISDDHYSVDLGSSGYRLPIEAEWEYAAKGGRSGMNNVTIFSGSNSLDSVGWFNGNNDIRTRSVGQKKPNPLGLYDMSGNVMEWCWDWYGDYPGSLEKKDYVGPDSGRFRIIRGGSWNYNAVECRVSYRDSNDPIYGHSYYGFRLSKAL